MNDLRITLNGRPYELQAEMSVHSLLDVLGFAGKPVVVELNEQAVFPRDYGQTAVKAGARVELVTLAAGG